MSSRWTHAMCLCCWDDMFGNSREPTKVIDAEEEKCCFCGLGTKSGIYIRFDPNHPWLVCGGKHGDE